MRKEYNFSELKERELKKGLKDAKEGRLVKALEDYSKYIDIDLISVDWRSEKNVKKQGELRKE